MSKFEELIAEEEARDSEFERLMREEDEFGMDDVAEFGRDAVEMIDTAGRGLADGMTMGYGDEIAGTLNALTPDFIQEMWGQPEYVSDMGIMDQIAMHIAAQEDRSKELGEDNPVTSITSDVAGTILGPGKLIKGAKGIGPSGRAADIIGDVLGWAGAGAVRADAEGEDPLTGALLGGAGAGIGRGIGAVGTGIAKGTKNVYDATEEALTSGSGKVANVLDDLAEGIGRGQENLIKQVVGDTATLGARGLATGGNLMERGAGAVEAAGPALARQLNRVPGVGNVAGNVAEAALDRPLAVAGVQRSASGKSDLSETTFNKQLMLSTVEGTQFEAPVADAIARGEQSYAAIMNVLMKNPEFRRIIED